VSIEHVDLVDYVAVAAEVTGLDTETIIRLPNLPSRDPGADRRKQSSARLACRQVASHESSPLHSSGPAGGGRLRSWHCASVLGGVSDGPARRKQSCARRRGVTLGVIQMSPKHSPARSRRKDERRPVSTPLAFGASSGRFSGRRLAVKRWALGPAGRPSGDSGAGHPLAGGYVGHGARRGGDGDSDVSLQRAVTSGVIWHSILPAAPHDARPGAADGA
jgi:hypothetical protein